MKLGCATEASSKHTQTQPNIPPLGDIANDVSCHAWRKTLLGRLLPNREADAKCLKALMHFGRACELRFSTGRGTHPDPIRQAVSFKKPLGVGDFMALKQACSTDCHRAQGAFKDSMIHGILQFTLPIAFRCVLHRWENQEIRCRKLCIVCWPVTVQPSSTFILTIRVCSEERPQERPQKTSLKPFSKTVHTGLWMYSGCRRPGTLFGVRMACPNLH